MRTLALSKVNSIVSCGVWGGLGVGSKGGGGQGGRRGGVRGWRRIGLVHVHSACYTGFQSTCLVCGDVDLPETRAGTGLETLFIGGKLVPEAEEKTGMESKMVIGGWVQKPGDNGYCEQPRSSDWWESVTRQSLSRFAPTRPGGAGKGKPQHTTTA